MTFKALIVWLMLLALPVQGFASATTLLCAPLPATAMHHAVTNIGGTAQHPHAAHTSHTHPTTHATHADHQPDGKCGACAACCFGASMALSLVSAMPVQAARFEVIPFDSGYVPTVDLALPERPPRA